MCISRIHARQPLPAEVVPEAARAVPAHSEGARSDRDLEERNRPVCSHTQVQARTHVSECSNSMGLNVT